MMFSILRNLIKGVLLALLNLPLFFLWFSEVEIAWKTLRHDSAARHLLRDWNNGLDLSIEPLV